GDQSSARAGGDGRSGRIPGPEGQACESRHHASHRHVAEEDALDRAVNIARRYLGSRRTRPVWPSVTLDDLRASLDAGLPDGPLDAAAVIDALAQAAEPGLVTTTGPRYFGFVTGGALPATVAAEWLTTIWDQPASLFVLSPAASI